MSTLGQTLHIILALISFKYFRCMNKKVMGELNMEDRKNNPKIPFKDTALYRIILKVCLEAYGDAKSVDIAERISKELKYAPDKKGGTGRKKRGND